jgi:hypothetical protein
VILQLFVGFSLFLPFTNDFANLGLIWLVLPITSSFATFGLI